MPAWSTLDAVTKMHGSGSVMWMSSSEHSTLFSVKVEKSMYAFNVASIGIAIFLSPMENLCSKGIPKTDPLN